MFKIFRKTGAGCLFFTLILVGSVCFAADLLDKDKYIGIDEIKAGMQAYCLANYKGTEVEKFDLEVLSVVRNIMPGRDAILVQGTDERFIHTGPVAGISGSPVYIDGRLAGALSFGFLLSKDALYGVTPIKDMLSGNVAKLSKDDSKTVGTGGFVFDFSTPLDFDKIDKEMRSGKNIQTQNYMPNATVLPCPLIASGLPVEVCRQLNEFVEPFGLMVTAGIGGGTADPTKSLELQNTSLQPGGTVTIPLVTGDIAFDVIGAITAVEDDKVYCFGHGFLGYGTIDLPMATGRTHTVVSNIYQSFKLASSLEIVGAFRTDSSMSVIGLIGAKANMIPLTIRTERYDATEKKVYNCRMADNKLLTPMLLSAAVAGSTLAQGNLPPEHVIEYKVAIDIADGEAIVFENVSTNRGLGELMREGIGSVAVVLNNPYKKIDIKSIDFDIRIRPKNISSHIWSVDLSDSTVKAGEKFDVDVVVESYLAGKKKHQFSINIPEGLKPGKYDLIVSGVYDYHKFLVQSAPYRFIPDNLTSLIEVINNVLDIKRDRLYCILVLPSAGVAVEKAELPDLPATKALVFQDAKRTLKSRPFRHWIEKNLQIGSVVLDRKVMHITVEK